MDEKYPIVSLYGLRFNLANDLSALISCIIIFAVVFALSRHLTMKPNKKQNALEWMVDFTNNIVKSAMPGEEGKQFYLLAFVLFLYIFIANQLGLIIQVIFNGFTWVKSPTTDPVITMSFALIVLLLSHYYGVQKFGFKGYLANFAKPVSFLLPINLLEEFTNFLTLSLRLYGNIFAGEVLLNLLAKMALSHGWITSIVTMPLEMIWQGFSVFIGSIQAFVFVTLAMVYISDKLESE
ncbi:atpB protein [Lactobacillus selangorensis]|uniref:ATP synthase subunit a n=1 Tax=Lactobacillus selangorensis TaxID=81857 RepID=A0A0R2G070_9LACO|nr:F0F1 ATP synthase subunit A [Lactobacillus selangorensis]KRN29308.1 atpB protein [Lactobacillus selangorensis]KRN34163.1 atpB protein [Lactobacillus selangorensis]